MTKSKMIKVKWQKVNVYKSKWKMGSKKSEQIEIAVAKSKKFSKTEM